MERLKSQFVGSLFFWMSLDDSGRSNMHDFKDAL